MSSAVQPKLASFHRHYYEIHAETPAELGERMGRLFGPIVRAFLAEARAQSDWREKIAAAQPLLECTERYFPRYLTEMRSYAIAAGVPFPELWALNCEADLDAREHCTTIVTNDGKLVAHNEDWDAEAAESICLVKKRLPSITILELYYYDGPLGGNALSVNSHGYVQAINSLQHSDFQAGVPRNVIARWLSETSDIEFDFELMRRVPRASGFNHVVVNSNSDVVDIECTAAKQRLVHPRLPFVHTNHYLTPKLAAYEEADGDDSTFCRYATACRLLRNEMTVDDVMQVMSETGNGKDNSIFNENTVARAVLDWPSRSLLVWLRREGEAGWVSYPLDWVKAPAGP